MDVANEIRALKERIGRLEGRVVSAGTKGPNHELLDGSYHPDTLNEDPVAGDVIIANATPKWTKLAKDTNGKFMSLVAGFPSWVNAPAGGITAYGLELIDENFDSLANGNIHGQGTYTHAGAWDVVAAAGTTCEIVANPGNGKMLRLHDASVGNEARCRVDINPGYDIAMGILEFKIKTNVKAAASRGVCGVCDSANPANWVGFYFNGVNQMRLRTPSGTTDIGVYAVDTWYSIILVFDCLAQAACIWVDDGFQARRAFAGNVPPIVNRILCYTNDAHSGQDLDIDDLLFVNLNRKAE